MKVIEFVTNNWMWIAVVSVVSVLLVGGIAAYMMMPGDAA